MGARDDELRHSRGHAFRGGSDSAMMNDGTAPGKKVLEARVRDVKRAHGEQSARGIHAEEQTAKFKLLRNGESSGLKMVNIKIGGAMGPSHRRCARVEEVFKVRGQRTWLANRNGKTELADVCRPVRLRSSVPIRKQSGDAFGSMECFSIKIFETAEDRDPYERH